MGPINGAGYAQYSLQDTFRPGQQTGVNRESQNAAPPSPEKNTGQNIAQTSTQQIIKESNPVNADLTRVSTSAESQTSPLETTGAARGQNLDVLV